jgi:hypothetical protein
MRRWLLDEPPCQPNFYVRAAINNAALNYGKATVANSRKRLAPIVILYVLLHWALNLHGWHTYIELLTVSVDVDCRTFSAAEPVFVNV